MQKFVLATILCAVMSTSAAAANFSLYPGFRDRNATVEMTTDKGLIVEMVVRCRRKANGQISPGIMTYSKVERLYCSSKNRCGRSFERAFTDTCS